jgi:uncharacterized protein
MPSFQGAPMSIDAEPRETTVLDSEPVEVEARPKAEPVAAADRVTSVDVLRGFALLGILAMNIVGFAWPMAAYANPLRGGGFNGFDAFIWVFNHLFFEMKMMTLFSMLFGAGLVLMTDRSDKRGASLRGVYYRRVLWLIVIGLIHSYLIWDGDILVLYGQCGLLIYLFRRLKPRTLIIVGLVFVAMLVPVVLTVAAGMDFLKATAAKAQAAEKAGKKPTKFQAWIEEVWTKKVLPQIDPDSPKRAEEFAKEVKTFRGSYWGIVKHRAAEQWKAHTFGFVLGGFWLAGGRMLIGMGLMKMGVFAALRSWRFYFAMLFLGYGIGLPLMCYDAYGLIQHRFSVDYMLHGGILINLFGSIVVALGHVGALCLIYKSGVLTWLTRRLAAVGQMALTNYLTHSIVCTTIFYGYGFNRYATINRAGLAGIVLAIWIAQLLISPVWLARFKFGPAEWLWRSLTYWRAQPMLRPRTVQAL